MEGVYKEWWYKDKNDGCKSKMYFCLFQSYILVINYGCLKDLLLIIKPNQVQNTILPKKISEKKIKNI